MFGLMKIKDFAKELAVPESTVRTWRRRGDIPLSCFQEIGNTVFVKVEEVKKWLDN
jgi:predicted site-specific integrase-resolvase